MHDGGLATLEDNPMRLVQLSEGFGPARAVQLAAELGIADLLGGSPQSAEELASATSTNPNALYSLLRAVAAVGVFTEVAPRRFALTPVGERLRADHPQSLKSWVRFQAMFNGVYAEAMYSLRTGEPTVPKVFGEPLFEHLAHHPEHAQLFQAAMGEHSRLTGSTLADAYEFADGAKIVDVGGGDGSFLTAVLSARQDMTGVVFDQPYVGEAAAGRLQAAGLADRCTFVSGDFLQGIPAGGDVYTLKGVVHNWPDEDVRRIFANCRRAMAPDGRLLLIEWVIPDGDAFHPSKFLDLAMLFVYGGRERTEDEYAGLLAESGLRLEHIVGTGTTLNVIEAVPS